MRHPAFSFLIFLLLSLLSRLTRTQFLPPFVMANNRLVMSERVPSTHSARATIMIERTTPVGGQLSGLHVVGSRKSGGPRDDPARGSHRLPAKVNPDTRRRAGWMEIGWSWTERLLWRGNWIFLTVAPWPGKQGKRLAGRRWMLVSCRFRVTSQLEFAALCHCKVSWQAMYRFRNYAMVTWWLS